MFMVNEIREIRKKYGLTQVELAKMLEVSQPRISEMEKQESITVKTLRRIAKKLRVSIKDIVTNGD